MPLGILNMRATFLSILFLEKKNVFNLSILFFTLHKHATHCVDLVGKKIPLNYTKTCGCNVKKYK